MAEFYFDYNFKLLKNELKADLGTPKLHIERNYSTENVNYIMYITFPAWNATREGRSRPTAFTSVSLFYDVCAIGVDSVVDVETEKEAKANDIEVRRVFDYDTYAKNGFRFIVTSDEEDYSGVGKVILKNTAGDEAVYFFAVNFGFKKKISYRIEGNNLILEGEKTPEKLKFVINVSSGRGEDFYPCLVENVEELSSAKTFSTDFSDGPFKRQLPEEYAGKKIYLSFTPNDDESKKYYMIECTRNDSLGIDTKEFKRQTPVPFCPYCHKKMDARHDLLARYKRGGAACSGKVFEEGGDREKKRIDVFDGRARKKLAKNVLYCEKDFRENGDALYTPDPDIDLMRTLPDDFFGHNHFKIIIVGSKRAGKTTFISRLFGIKGKGEDTEFHCNALRNGTKKLFEISPYSITTMRKDEKVTTTKDSWYKDNNSFYSEYSIDIDRGIYPTATNTAAKTVDQDKRQDITKHPFVMEVNKKDYVYFYDMAGEDAQRSTDFIDKLVKEAPAAIFYLVDSNAKKTETSSVSMRISEVLRDRKQPCPIAVILTKFDSVESKFDENCQCLRSDVQDMISGDFEGSALEDNINIASEEIRSYLSQNGINPDFGKNANVKYFAVSAFATSDAINHEEQRGTNVEINYLLHESSPKRMELPIIWTLRQFGCIT